MKNLKDQIAELKASDKLQKTAERKLKGMKVSTFFMTWGKKGTTQNVNIDLTNEKLGKISDLIQDIRTAYPTTKNAVLSFAGSDAKETGSPFILRFKNPCTHKNTAEIEYVSGKNSISIELPVSFYSDDLKGVFTRKVTDCEYHYFPGVDIREILKMEIRGYKSDMFETVSYFGGDKVTHINQDATIDEKQEFETFVLNGHVPEFAAYWKQTLISNDNL